MTQVHPYDTVTGLNCASVSGAQPPVALQMLKGDKLLVTLVVTAADPGASVSVSLGNDFAIDGSFPEIETLARTGVGRVRKVITDFHSLIQLTATVTGGAATFQVGLTLMLAGGDSPSLFTLPYDNVVLTRDPISKAVVTATSYKSGSISEVLTLTYDSDGNLIGAKNG